MQGIMKALAAFLVAAIALVSAFLTQCQDSNQRVKRKIMHKFPAVPSGAASESEKITALDVLVYQVPIDPKGDKQQTIRSERPKRNPFDLSDQFAIMGGSRGEGNNSIGNKVPSESVARTPNGVTFTSYQPSPLAKR